MSGDDKGWREGIKKVKEMGKRTKEDVNEKGLKCVASEKVENAKEKALKGKDFLKDNFGDTREEVKKTIVKAKD
jgi:hypothetical protein